MGKRYVLFDTLDSCIANYENFKYRVQNSGFNVYDFLVKPIGLSEFDAEYFCELLGKYDPILLDDLESVNHRY